MTRSDRQHPRYAHEAAVTFLAADRAITGHTRNVSHGGLCAMLTEELSVGTPIEIDLQLVFLDNRRSEPLRLPARIAWCTAIGNAYQIGVQFLALHDETVSDLTMFLRFLDGRTSVRALSATGSLDDRFG
ncbi:MAG TPA: PilZ domain-containing protein [Kofleriaceae bacterium]|nr:PilZ domain-containing protein [Kofleriaceae bacterium]